MEDYTNFVLWKLGKSPTSYQSYEIRFSKHLSCAYPSNKIYLDQHAPTRGPYFGLYLEKHGADMDPNQRLLNNLVLI